MPRSRSWKRLLKALAIAAATFAIALALGLAACWPSHRAPPVPGSTVSAQPTASEETADARIERLTQERLALLQTHLATELAAQRDAPDAFETDLRTAAIELSMKGPLADLSESSLAALGDHAWLRRSLFFAMPTVRWMSAPFLFPVDANKTGSGDSAFSPLIALVQAKSAAGMGVSLDNVGDASLSPADSAAYRAYYAGLLRAYARAEPAHPLHVSLKLSALVHDLPAALAGQDNAKRREIVAALRELLTVAQTASPAGAFIRIDMEEHEYKELTIQVFRELVERSPDIVRRPDGGLAIGIVVQAYSRESARDLAGIADWARAHSVRVPVRLVKGAYESYEKDSTAGTGRPSPVWDNKSSTDASYEALAEYLLRNRDAFSPAFATHNLRTQARVMAIGDTLAIPPGELEIQMLYGMGDPIKRAVLSLGYGLREYVPAGPLHRGLKYAGRRFHELANPQNALSRTLHGDFSVLADQPEFKGAADRRDGEATLALLRLARSSNPSKPEQVRARDRGQAQ